MDRVRGFRMIAFEPGFVVLVVFGLISITMAVLVYVSHRYINVIEALLERSHYVRGVKENFSQAGLPGKVLRTCNIACLLTLPGPYLRRGFVNPEEMKNFPRAMKRVLVGLWLALTIEVLAVLGLRAWFFSLSQEPSEITQPMTLRIDAQTRCTF